MKNLNPYVPGEQPKDRTYIKLNANENPFPPCADVVQAVSDFVNKNPMSLALYPDPDSLELREEIAFMLTRTGGVLCRSDTSGTLVRPAESDRIPFALTPDMIYCGNGSDEVLSFIFYAFFGSETPLVLPEFSYSFYPVYAGFYGISTDIVPMNKDGSLDSAELLRRAKKNGSGIIFANPNAPSALALSRNQVRAMLEDFDSDKVFVVDEAYCDFGGESCIPLLKDFKNLVIVRTFSKSFSGAGFRLGYMVANPELVNAVTTVKNSLNHFPVDAMAQVAGKAACRNDFYYADCAKKIVSERNDFTAFLRERGWILNDSMTNFVLAKNPFIAGKKVYEEIKKDGILVRHFATKGIEDYVRISIGNHSQMQALMDSICRFS